MTTKELLQNYVNTAADLAETIKKDIQKDGRVSNKTVLALNQFIIAANELSDITNELNETDTNKH